MNSTSNEPPAGILLVDKPAGISSFDIIRALRRQTGIRKIGHAGTLDPAATGLMLMLIGAATKQAQHLSGLAKTYQAQLYLGYESSTGDREGELRGVSDRQPTRDDIETAAASFLGEITQTPSAYSAIKIGGVRAYKLARAGQEVQMPPRQVTIHTLEVLDYQYPLVTIRTHVSSGTYIRSLGEDIGRRLGTGAYLGSLRREQIGEYQLSQAHALPDITAETISADLLA